MSSHTPGPWESKRRLVWDTNGFSLADCWDYNRTEEECFANARLIAAAPDMLEALEYVNAKSTIDMDDAMIDVVTAAIAKAKGEARCQNVVNSPSESNRNTPI